MKLAVLLVIASAFAADLARADFELPFWGNRREGIVNAKNVSGVQIDLVGLQIKSPTPIGSRAKSIFLYVPMPESDGIKELSVSVDEFDSSYRMQPLFGTGSKRSDECEDPMVVNGWFCWPTAAVIDEKHVQRTKLLSLATDAEGRLYPVLLAPERQHVQERTYVFSIRSAGELGGTWQVLSQGGDVIGKGDIPMKPPGVVQIPWTTTEAVEAEWYRFRVDGKVYMEDAIRKARIEKTFRHDPRQIAER
jgi:hypothetical protein